MLGSAVLGYLAPPKLQALSIPMRLAESLSPQLLAATALVSIGVICLGYRRLGLLYLALALAGGVWIAADFLGRTGPRGAQSDLRVLWINLLYENTTSPAYLAQRLIDSEADVVIVAEPLPLTSVLPRLDAHFPYRDGTVGCNPECGLLVLSRRPLGTGGAIDLGPYNPNGLYAFVLDPAPQEGAQEGHTQPAVIAAVHLLKPWYLAFIEGEQEHLDAALSFQSKPLLLVGDFNAAPWSRRLRELQRKHRLEPVWPPFATWPTRAGAFGVPLDQVMQRDGLHVVSARPWGEDMGSNHRGIMIEVDLP